MHKAIYIHHGFGTSLNVICLVFTGLHAHDVRPHAAPASEPDSLMGIIRCLHCSARSSMCLHVVRLTISHDTVRIAGHQA
jgi:hypothetical protein